MPTSPARVRLHCLVFVTSLLALSPGKRYSSTSVGGHDTSRGDSQPGHAVGALADQLVEYCETKKKPR